MLFFHRVKNLYTCKKEEKNISIEPQALQEKNFVVFGMKACDIQGVKVLDNVFLSDPIDTFYAARRDHGTIVALACHEPEESCFCKYSVLTAQTLLQMLQHDDRGRALLETSYRERGSPYKSSCRTSQRC